MSDTPLQILGIGGGVDKNGVVSIEVPFWVASLSEAISHKPSLDITLPLVSRNFKQAEDGGYEVTLHYEGIEAKTNDDQTTFEFDVSMSEDPIESHPNFDKIAEKYGWDDVEKLVPKTAPSSASSGSALGKSSSTKKNPLYGTESYLAVGAVFRKTYAAQNIPASVLKGIGSIISRPPNIGQFQIPDTGSKRNWLKLAPKIRRRGSAAEITEDWMLSGPNGWKKDIYDGGQLEDSSGGSDSGGGLTTGGLTTGSL